MKILFFKDVPRLGKRGEIKEVSDGYAKNFLIPKKFATIATADIQARLEKETREAAASQAKQQAKLKQLQQDLVKRTFTLKVKVGDKGQIFGGLHAKDIIAVVNDKINTNLEKQQVDLEYPIKKLGEHIVPLKLGGGITAELKINVKALT